MRWYTPPECGIQELLHESKGLLFREPKHDKSG